MRYLKTFENFLECLPDAVLNKLEEVQDIFCDSDPMFHGIPLSEEDKNFVRWNKRRAAMRDYSTIFNATDRDKSATSRDNPF